jgi:hypothetical protein
MKNASVKERKQCRQWTITPDCIIKKKKFKLAGPSVLTAHQISLVTPPSSNGWTIPLRKDRIGIRNSGTEKYSYPGDPVHADEG